jgi:hypothetical protein
MVANMKLKVKVKRKLKVPEKSKPKYRLNKSNLQKVSVKVQAPKAATVYPAFGAGGGSTVVTIPSSSNGGDYATLLSILSKLDISGPLTRPGVMVSEPHERTERFVPMQTTESSMSPLNIGLPATAIPLQTQPPIPSTPVAMDVQFTPGTPMDTGSNAGERGQTVRPGAPIPERLQRPRQFVRTNGGTPDPSVFGRAVNLDIPIPLQVGPYLSPHNGRIVPYAGNAIVNNTIEDDDL